MKNIASYIVMLACLTAAATVFTSCDDDSESVDKPTTCPVTDDVDEARHKEMMVGLINKQADVMMLVYRLSSCMAEPMGVARDVAVAGRLGGMGLRMTMADGRSHCILSAPGGPDGVSYTIDVTRKDSALVSAGSVWSVDATIERGRELDNMTMMVVVTAPYRLSVADGRCFPYWYFVNGDILDMIDMSDSRTFCYIDYMSYGFATQDGSEVMTVSGNGRMTVIDDPREDKYTEYSFSAEAMRYVYCADGGASPYLTRPVGSSIDIVRR